MNENKENFRDSISTISKEGNRNYIYPKKPKGKFTNYRTIVSWFLLAFFLLSPFIKINGNQFLLFNVLERKFNIFGQPFWPQDFYLLVFSMLIGVVFIILFTVIFGRIFCGWICPQTIFMEMVFRKVEYLIDGDRGKQIKLAKQEWNAEKIWKRILKWFIFFLISFIIANVFLAYLIGSDVLIQHIKDGPFNHLATLSKLIIFTLVFLWIFGWFREQVCIIACPYGRLQGVMLDNNSIVVAYDYKRGENENGRSKIRKGENRDEQGFGDCIDCKQCVLVCPTGIDIRNGTQLECINCTACIDACDEIMRKVDFEPGLIKYASESNIAQEEKFRFSPRIISYIAVLTILLVGLVSLIFARNDVEATVLRLPGQMYSSQGDSIQNVYTVKIVNKTNNTFSNLQLELIDQKGSIQVIGGDLNVPKNGLIERTLFIKKAKKDIENQKIIIGVFSNGMMIEDTKTSFPSPLIVK
ncbi:cytochrome c oxidase accessory protein CcoG [Namhaeicola litoreus]|uniref:Cytochrome c oxidase accessory protein CcoG n=1 Tax=Namhaeicola litoreus TaxID=1052145 RepID=A0ABW3Y397_9FLAO